MKIKGILIVVPIAAALAVLSGKALTAQDKYTVKVPDGLAFKDFKGYETWQVVSVSHPAPGEGASGNEALNVIVANPVMIDAYQAGVPGSGKPWPDGAKAAKMQYIPKKSTEAPFSVQVPDKLRN